MESAAVPAGTPTGGPQTSEHGLKKDAIGFLDGLIIGISSTAPAYSLAAVLAIVVVQVGVQAPAVLLVSFIPMFLIASSFYYMNRADPDCGTSFSWITRAIGPGAGWLGGWAICTTGHPRRRLAGRRRPPTTSSTWSTLDSLRDSKLAVTLFAIVIIVVMTRDLRDRHRAVRALPAVPDPGRRSARCCCSRSWRSIKVAAGDAPGRLDRPVSCRGSTRSTSTAAAR